MTWTGIVGRSFTSDQFEKYVGSLKFGLWRPRFVCVHNTGSPDRKTWDNWQARKPPITDEKWAKNLEGWYRDTQKWPGSPHLFVTPAGILVMNPLTMKGTHSPSWNTVSWGVETVGDFDRDAFTGSIRDNLVAALAILHAAAGLQLLPYERGVRGLHFHREDPKTSHKDCPGKNVGKAELIALVQAEIVRRHPGEHPADEGGTFGKVKTAPDDPLNVREAAGGRSKIVATIPHGAKVTILGGTDVGVARWLNIKTATVSGWVAGRFVETT